MTTSVLICDDSAMARKQLARCLPKEWPVLVTFAANGTEALEHLRTDAFELLFLDLNMPEIDGYQVLERMIAEDINCKVIVVSGDIQPDANRRVRDLGAIDFIKKPVNIDKLNQLLRTEGFIKTQGVETVEAGQPETDPATLDVDMMDAYREIANVAMGQAGNLLGTLLNVFVELPVPKVNLIEVNELTMALRAAEEQDTISAVCQGFVGEGIAGEALLLFHDSSFKDMAKLTKYPGELGEQIELELLMDVANILIGAYLKGIAEQLDVNFSQGQPLVLGQHSHVGNIIDANAKRWKKTLTIEIPYSIEGYQIHCDLLLLYTEDSLDTLNKKIAYMLE